MKTDKQIYMIVESELDAMLLTMQAGDLVSVIALGSAATKPDSSVFYDLKKADLILVALDFDDAGKKSSKWWIENFENAKYWPCPVGKDPGEAFQAGVDLKAWVMAGLPPSITMLKEGANGN